MRDVYDDADAVTGWGGSARAAGALLLFSAAATAAMVVTRLAADADKPTLTETLAAVADGREMYAASAAMRILAGLALAAAAWFLTRTWIIRSRLGTPVVPYLLAASGIVTVAAGAAAIYIASETGAGGAPVTAARALEAAEEVRWITGKVGFVLAGAALIVAARYQWKAGHMLRRMAPASLALGVAMQLIWVDSATLLHPVVGTGFFLWLGAVGTMLATGRVERYFAATFGRPSGT